MQKAILKAQHVGFQYPGTAKQQIFDATFQLSLSSRVAILGPNGSGKSTLVKILTREMEPNKGGTVWAHPNLVVGYIAQHAFHHIDNHLDSTAMDYLQWRYATGEDREEMDAVHKVITEDEEAAMAKPIVIEGEKRFFEEITGRRKLKNSYEYEVRWKGKSSVDSTWMPRDKLMQLGFGKVINQCDSIEAQKSGLLRKLIRSEIEQHFRDCGLDPEFVIHNNLRGLSGGQKVKVVLAAATWRRPQLLVLDEPTNYLDRESLAALCEALKSFKGGVVIVTHSRDLSEQVCSEVWSMKEGYLTPSGHDWRSGEAGAKVDVKEAGDQFDEFGNKVESKKAKKLSSGDARKLKKKRIELKKQGIEVDGMTDEEILAL